MLLKNITLSNYRNYNALNLEFSAQGAVITGDNGIGKTNLLEAVYFLAFGRSFRTNHDYELIRFEQDFFRIQAMFSHNDSTVNITAAADRNSKSFKINSRPLEKMSELFAFFKTVYFSPSDLQIVMGSPAVRRLFLDQAISQYDGAYIDALRKFRHILKQRNALLKTEFSQQEKDSWDILFTDAADKVIMMRLAYLRKFKPLLIEKYQQFMLKKEYVDVNYKFSTHFRDDNYSRNELLLQLKKHKESEVLAQRTIMGPHLDDLVFLINGLDARIFASQGQARSLVIIARLVQALLISSHSSQKPLLMFDDVLSELDEARAMAFLELIKDNYQLLIATPFLSHYKNLDIPHIKLNDYI